MRALSACSSLILRLDFLKSVFFPIFWQILWLECPTFIIFLLTQRNSLSGPFEYLEHDREVYRKIFGDSWKKFHSKNEVSANMLQPHADKALIFGANLFFKSLQKFFYRLNDRVQGIAAVRLD